MAKSFDPRKQKEYEFNKENVKGNLTIIFRWKGDNFTAYLQ